MAGKAHLVYWQVQRHRGRILFGLSTGYAILDVATTSRQLRACLAALRTRASRFRDLRLGSFGRYAIRLNLHASGVTSLLVDGPSFDGDRVQSAALWIDRRGLASIFEAVLAAIPARSRRPGRGL